MKPTDEAIDLLNFCPWTGGLPSGIVSYFRESEVFIIRRKIMFRFRRENLSSPVSIFMLNFLNLHWIMCKTSTGLSLISYHEMLCRKICSRQEHSHKVLKGHCGRIAG